MKASSFYLPIGAFLVSFILLVLPGSEFPKAKLFEVPGLDKIVHTGMFFLLTVLFCRSFRFSAYSISQRKRWFLQITVFALLYGVGIEFIQKYFVPFRSFEMADIAADGLGALIGYFVSRSSFSKTGI